MNFSVTFGLCIELIKLCNFCEATFLASSVHSQNQLSHSEDILHLFRKKYILSYYA